MGFRQRLKDASRIVVKVGSSTLTYDNGNINLSRIEKLTRVLSDVVNSGKQVTLVTSGAVAVGVNKLKFERKARKYKRKASSSSSWTMRTNAYI